MKRNREAFNKYRKQYHRDKRAYVLVSSAKKRGLPFDLVGHRADIQARIDAGYCELSGIRFDLPNGRTYASPSIDRIEPQKGYVYSNIRIVCNLMNMALGDWGEETLYAVFSAWKRQRDGEEIAGTDDDRAARTNSAITVHAV